MININLQAQNRYDIRLSQSAMDKEAATVCFEVQLKSATSESWELAGQNYRLFYDTNKASFLAGKSLLGNKYQSFKLVQDEQNIDASSINGSLNYEADLGFLNFAIDLRDATSSAKVLAANDGTWLSTAEICFQVNNLADSLPDFEITWARNGHTDEYATSFVEISTRIGVNQLASSVGNSFYDWSPEISNQEEEEEGEEIEDTGMIVQAQIQAAYDIRLSQSAMDKEASMVCFEVQLKNATPESWELAGQNYRLYYDSEKANFLAGKSLLGDKYQAFKLVQDEQNLDASAINGLLNYEADLGFLNYAIDLLSTTSSAKLLPADGTWLSTSEICFQVDNLTDSLANFEITWARNGQTNEYATSFVEISNRTGVNQLASTIGNLFYDWLPETSSQEEEEEMVVQAKIFLQGAYRHDDGLMQDKLRQLNYIPLETAYNEPTFLNDASFKLTTQKREILTQEVFNVEGKDAIVDWVFLELRDKQTVGKVIATRSALVQRDGDIVDLDGKSTVKFSIPNDAYYLVIRHRNHLGIMSESPIDFTKSNNFIDFTKPEILVYGKNARKIVNGIALMWGGNADHNQYLVFQGGGVAIPDADYIFFEVFSDESNIHSRYNHIINGYFSSDLNMDGEIRYQGGANEIDDLIFFNVFSHPQNTQFFSNFFIQEQVPPRIE